MKFTIGLDLGTTSVKGILLAENNTIFSTKTFTVQYRTNFGYRGFDMVQYRNQIFEMIRELAREVPEGGKITAIASACASGNTVLCDSENLPLCDAVSWVNDSMAAESEIVFGSEMIESEKVRSLSGWPFLGTFSLAHLAHLKIKHPDLFSKAAKITMSGEYLNFCLCGKWGIDRSSATPFYLLDQTKGTWHKPYLKALGIDETMLPTVMQTGDVLGTVTKEAAEKCGLSTDTKVVLGAFDHPCAAFASDIVEEGQMLLSCGTSWVCLFPLRNRQMIMEHKLLCDVYRAPEGCYGAMASVPNIGPTLDGIIRLCAGDTTNMYDKFYELADAAKPGAGGLEIDMTAKCLPSVIGYSSSDIARAAIEGIGRALLQSIKQLQENGIQFKNAVMVGGPSQNKTCRDILSDILKMPVDYKYGVNSGAVGAALIAQGQF